MNDLEKELEKKFKQLRKEKDDQEKEYFSGQISDLLRNNLDQYTALDYDFSKLSTVSTIKSPDGDFRLINWNIEMSDLSHKYFCFMVKKKNVNSVEVIEFSDRSMEVFEEHTQKTFTNTNWFGCLYYKIIPVKKGAKTIYTMLAYDGNNDRSNIKFVEGMMFAGKRVKLGVPIIQTNEGLLKRYFLEHSEKTIISLNHDPKRNMIVMDHLVPENEKLEGMYEFYVPCFSYDGLRFDNGKWVLEEDVVAVNKPQEKNLKVQVGENKFVSMKNKWVDPTNNGTTGTHTAVTPEDIEKQNKKKDADKDRKLKYKKAKYLNNRNQRSIIYEK
ncbi:MAG: hypothetical protein KDC84_06990 [Crocinitomicaceae bacterium]|nr:hypothetical protein [Crocinitomicaceae bacterium]